MRVQAATLVLSTTGAVLCLSCRRVGVTLLRPDVELHGLCRFEVTLLRLVCQVGVALLRSAPGQGVSRPPHTASRDCRNGSPLARAIPCAPAPEYGDTWKKEQAGKRLAKRCSRGVNGNPHPLSPIPHAAERAVTGWRGGLGRVGADLASAGSMRPPPSPAHHVSTARLATQHVTPQTAHHHKRQARTATQPNTPAKKQHATTKASTTKTARRTRQRVHPAFMQPATQSAA